MDERRYELRESIIRGHFLLVRDGVEIGAIDRPGIGPEANRVIAQEVLADLNRE